MEHPVNRPCVFNRNLFLKDFCHRHGFRCLFVFSFLLWVFAFRGFIFCKLTLASDAYAYYEHTKYFIDGLMRGVFPMWDPTRDQGVPNDFFLRRIGAYNPVYLLIVVLNKIGVTYTYAY